MERERKVESKKGKRENIRMMYIVFEGEIASSNTSDDYIFIQ